MSSHAQSTLSDVGSSVPMLMETLNDDKLREARRATFQNNPGKMQELVRQAVERLARMPENNPDAFAGMMEGMSPEERGVQNTRGEWIVSIPGHPVISFATAVRARIVRV